MTSPPSPRMVEVMEAVQAGRVTATDHGRLYVRHQKNGRPWFSRVHSRTVRGLKRRGLVTFDVEKGGPVTLTEDGFEALAWARKAAR